MKIYREITILLLLTAISACSKMTADNSGIAPQKVIHGEVNPESYADAAKETLAHAQNLANSEPPPEHELDVDIGKIEALLTLSAQKDLDKEHAYDAALMSTLGSLYARKAQINKNTPRIAGELVAKAFRYLDKAVSLYPQDLGARITRGFVSSKVPDFLGKAEVAYEDLTYVRNSADFSKLPVSLQETIKQSLAEVDSRRRTSM